MPKTSFKIPNENHGRLLVPGYAEIPSVVAENDELFEKSDAMIAGMSLEEFRARVRSRIAEMLGVSIDKPVFITAHQPGLWHPGILYKCAVAKRFSGRYFLLSINIDSDVVNAVSCNVPYQEGGRLHRENVIIVPNEEGKVIERIGKPDAERLNEILDGMGEKTATLPGKTVLENLRRFREINNREYDRSETCSQWLTNCRKEYYPVEGLHEIDISALSNTEEFRLFAWEIIENCERFFEIYNSCLDRYREENNIRYPANPFPNLERRTEKQIELPFWMITENGTRQPLYVACTEKNILALDDEILVETAREDSGPHLLESYQIRPKAVLLTMFMRMCAGSIFVHGVGGGNYDEVTDGVIREYLGCEPPEYIVATKTEFLPLDVGGDTGQKLKEAKDELRNMKFNPDEYLSQSSPLVEEKRAILAKDRHDTTKEEYRRLKKIRETLVKEIEQKIAGKQREADALEKEASKVENVMRRDFPYFFFPVEGIED